MGVLSSHTGVLSSYMGVLSSYMGVLSSYMGVLSSHTGVLSSYMGVLSSHTGVLSSYMGVLSSHMGVLSSYMGVLFSCMGMRGLRMHMWGVCEGLVATCAYRSERISRGRGLLLAPPWSGGSHRGRGRVVQGCVCHACRSGTVSRECHARRSADDMPHDQLEMPRYINETTQTRSNGAVTAHLCLLVASLFQQCRRFPTMPMHLRLESG